MCGLKCESSKAIVIDPVTDRIILFETKHIKRMAGCAIQITTMSSNNCDPVKWRQNQMLDGIAITAVDVNEDRKILCKKVNEGSIHLKKSVEKCVVLKY